MTYDLGTLLRDYRNACDAVCCCIDDMQSATNGLTELEDEAADLDIDIAPMQEFVATLQKLKPDLQQAANVAQRAYEAWDNAPQP
jgi:hypothetical protein